VFDWGVADRVAALLGAGVSVISNRLLEFDFRYTSAEHFVDTFRSYYGPTNRAFAALDADPAARRALHDDLLALVRDWNAAPGGALQVPSQYLELVAERTA
jgi:hypothetical protein